MNVRTLISIFLISLSLNLTAQSGKNNRPNIIFILADDQPYNYLGCNGNKIAKTPNLDKLAEEGTLFTNAHITSAICTPSRISILLSQYERKHGVNFNSGTSVAPEAWAKSYPVVMRNNGYYTGYIGKNHAPIGDGGYQSNLMEKSFDYWYAGHRHLSFYPKDRHKIFNGARNDTQLELLEEGVNDFINPNDYSLNGAKHFLLNRPKNKPFCLSLCFNLPHDASTSTMQMRDSEPEMYKSLYRDKTIPLPENYVAKKDIVTPKLPHSVHHVADRQSGYDYVDDPKPLRERYIRHMQTTTGIDALVGRVREQLEALNLDKNTIIIYSSDHGLMWGQYGLGGKALCYEQCTKVPLIVFNPTVSKKARGIRSDELVQSIDIAATMLSLAGIEQPEEFQGKDISALIKGEKQTVREYLFTENLWSTDFGNPRCDAIQTKEWKYIRYYKNENFSALSKIATAKELGMNVLGMLYSVHDPDIAVYRSFVEAPLRGELPVYEELFNLVDDPEESRNLVEENKHKQVLSGLRTAFLEEIRKARGEGTPKVLRYTKDSQLEKAQAVIPE